MDKFESQFEDLDVQTRVMDSSMAGMNALSTPEDQVGGYLSSFTLKDGHL
jgi:charged multivesicular body protein 1